MADELKDTECILDGPCATRNAATESVVRNAPDDLGRLGAGAPQRAPQTQSVADWTFHVASRDKPGKQLLA